jgi:protein-tyrosine-phosphatase
MPNNLPSSVLFACTQNSVRSPIAAALTRHLYPNKIYCRSAGVEEGTLDPFVDIVMAEIGVDITRHKPHTFAALADASFDLVISLSPEAKERAIEWTRTLAIDVEHWPTDDPTRSTGSREQRLSAYRSIRDELLSKVIARLGHPLQPI